MNSQTFQTCYSYLIISVLALPIAAIVKAVKKDMPFKKAYLFSLGGLFVGIILIGLFFEVLVYIY